MLTENLRTFLYEQEKETISGYGDSEGCKASESY